MKRIVFALALFCSAAIYAQTAGRGLQFDLGTEPDENGNESYGMIQYGWNDKISSRIDLKYTSIHKTEYEIKGYEHATDVSKSKIFEISFLPVIKYFGEKNNFSVGAGLSYQYNNEKEKAGMVDANGLMLNKGDEGKYFTMNHNKTAHFFAPRLSFTALFPFGEHFSFNFESFLHPIYLVRLKQDMNYHADQTAEPFDFSGEDSLFRVSAPYIFTKISFDIFNYIRFLAQFSYQRLNFRQMDWTADFNRLEGKDDVQNMTTFRIGLEFLTSKNLKARVRGGIYRQIEWNNSTYRNNTETESKWIVSFGTEM